ncbi:Ca2+ regulator and membrane fusion protein Fig1-domain-containing protein [Lophiotrema nucula]|uniref:Ca2+ regulator and membrane fusion protein Fig1-domain-containing protein n=1 Tax=Lophiotrema nucula TaxID=690887 RepID=A0A6A5Z0V2_9PLEO|nr:Ca2+ regulator and membrane fusion protein Fig1-domain-containing protein [Lophiotrema nucula]
MMGISNRMQNINYRLLNYLLWVPIILFYTLTLTGCISSSPGILNIFLLKLENPRRSSSTLEIRVGYFGLCILFSDQRICQSTSGKNTEAILATLRSTSTVSIPESDTLNGIVTVALTLQSKHVIGLLSGAAVLYLFSLVFIALLKRNFKMPLTAGNQVAIKRRNRLRQASFTTMWLSVGFALVSAITIHQTTNALSYITQVGAASLAITAGQTLIILQWLAFGLSVLFAVGITSMFPKEGGTISSTSSNKAAAPAIAPPLISAGAPRPPLPPPPPLSLSTPLPPIFPR